MKNALLILILSSAVGFMILGYEATAKKYNWRRLKYLNFASNSLLEMYYLSLGFILLVAAFVLSIIIFHWWTVFITFIIGFITAFILTKILKSFSQIFSLIFGQIMFLLIIYTISQIIK